MDQKKINKKRETKRETILNGAYRVFSKQGFLTVTMQDIIDECGISRGGIYLYFDSVDDIFFDTVTQRSIRQFDRIRTLIQNNSSFDKVFSEYLSEQKQRLLNHMNHGSSLLRAMYEYSFTHTLPRDKKLKINQLNATKETVRSLLNLGVTQHKIEITNTNAMTDTFMFLIEGMNVLALTGKLAEAQIDEQFALFMTQIVR